ncbi:MAG: tetratricopeptide repeat protein, partial [Planctomycetes bacterium]|nr:tetratricopeptide repeat protein [Planctomycetota bacterium]
MSVGRRWSAAIFGLAFLVRGLHLWQLSAAPFFGLRIVDAAAYDAWARRIAGGDWLGDTVFYQAPLYPYFLASVYRLIGDGPVPLLLFQAFLGSAACVLLAGAGARFFSRPAGIVSGLLLALYAPAIFFDSIVQKSVLDLFFLCLLLRILASVIDAPRRAGFVWMGITLGALVLTRENALVLVPVILLWISFSVPATWPRRGVLAGLLLLGLGLVLLPVALRNVWVGGEFHLTTSQLGPNLYIGNHAGATGLYEPLVAGRGHPRFEHDDATQLAEEALGRALSPKEVSDYWTEGALDYVRGDPLDWLGLMGRKFALAWNKTETVDAEDPYTYAEWSSPLRWGNAIFHFGVLAPLALFGAWVTWRRRDRIWVLYLLAVTYLASVLVFFVFARYRFPLVPLLTLFAAAGLVGARGFLARADRPQFAACIVATAAFAVFCNWPLSDHTWIRAATHHNFGLELKRVGRIDDAILEHRRAVSLNPGIAVFHNKLGHVLFRAKNFDEAAESFRRAIALDANYAEANYNLGTALAEGSDLRGAIEQFRIAIRLRPPYPKARYNLANTLVKQGELEKAGDEFEVVIQIEPDSTLALYNLGVLRMRQERLAEASSWLERAVASDPEFE